MKESYWEKERFFSQLSNQNRTKLLDGKQIFEKRCIAYVQNSIHGLNRIIAMLWIVAGNDRTFDFILENLSKFHVNAILWQYTMQMLTWSTLVSLG